MSATTMKKTNRRRSVHSAGVHGRTSCPLCRKYPRFNAETLAALREADEDDRYFAETGKHLPGVGVAQTLEEFLAEMAAL